MEDFKQLVLTPRREPDATAVVAYLKGLWKELLRVPDVKPDDNFFALGGDSVLVIEMLLAVSAHFDQEFEHNGFFHKPNITTLSEVVAAGLKGSHGQPGK